MLEPWGSTTMVQRVIEENHQHANEVLSERGSDDERVSMETKSNKETYRQQERLGGNFAGKLP
jgi:hypothetical protein